MEIKKLGSIGIFGGELQIATPTFAIVKTIISLTIMPGRYNCYAVLYPEEFGNRIGAVKVIHADYVLDEYCSFNTFENFCATNKIVFSIMDKFYYRNIIQLDPKDRDNWYTDIMSNLENNYYFKDDKCFTSVAGFGDGRYDLKIFNDKNNEIIGIEIPYLKTTEKK